MKECLVVYMGDTCENASGGSCAYMLNEGCERYRDYTLFFTAQSTDWLLDYMDMLTSGIGNIDLRSCLRRDEFTNMIDAELGRRL